MNLSPVFCRITKVDEERREVTGRATQEIVDRDGEIMDYATTKPEFMKWSAEVFADSGGLSHGNVRSMHGNVAAGKLTNIDFNDVEKAIDVTAKIVDPVEWEKVVQGVHTGFSIGGRYARKWSEPINGKLVTRYTAVPSEISIVDRPCCSASKFFTIHKRDGSIVRREFIDTHELALDNGKIALIEKRDFSGKKREQMARAGTALPDGSFPIANVSDLKNAVQAIGRAKNPAKAKAHIKARAKALGAESELPDTWKADFGDLSKLVAGEEPTVQDREDAYNHLAVTNAQAALASAKQYTDTDGEQLSQAAMNCTSSVVNGPLSGFDYLTRTKGHYEAAFAHTKAAGYHMGLDDIVTAHAHHGACEAHKGAAEYIMTSNLPQVTKADDGDLSKGGPGSGRHKGGGSDAQQKSDKAGQMATQITRAALQRTDEAEKNPSKDSHLLAAGQHAAAAIYQRKAADAAKPLNAGFENAHLGAAAMHDRMFAQHMKSADEHSKADKS